MTVMGANGMGVAAAGFYSLVYTKYTTSSMTKYFAGSAAYLTLPLAAYLTLPIEQAIFSFGLLGNAMAIMFFASPLAVIKTVIEEKSTKAMPFALSVASFANCASWASYGLFVCHDHMVTAPNIVGLALSSFQLSLFLRYGIYRPPADKPLDAKE